VIRQRAIVVPLPSAELHCSFCHKHFSRVKALLAGPKGRFICNECLMLADEIVVDGQTEAVTA
jgi:ATP-dependent protease Clp ATPase subunit